MAFSFRIGTKWCHDFPKLAKESGFYFNMHRSGIRIDWNRISNIDIDRIIREKDFHSIDDNINSVIDYCLESEYNVKILDPNFVKLFRLAQLAVEYLLYCKQYLDHSVVILKDELKSKIEENVKLKKVISTLEEVVKHVKEKAKERNKRVETKIGDSNGEIYRCPHCPKTFISAPFLSAHIVRRHSCGSELYMAASPIHEHYRNETEKLHNEIKNLKERLNETERVMRNETIIVDQEKPVNYIRKQVENEVESFDHGNNKRSEEYSEYKAYQDEIKNLKTILFDEIHNLKQKEKIMHENTSETNVQMLINQQEKEFQKLRNQLLEKLTPNLENMQAKLNAQENYWKLKLEHLETQHYKDVERLTMELKVTQKAADDMKAEYESKVIDLERQTADQSSILIDQSKRLQSLSQELSTKKNKDFGNSLSMMHNESVTLDALNENVKISDKSLTKQNHSVNPRIQQIIVESSTPNITWPSISLRNKSISPKAEEITKQKCTQVSKTKKVEQEKSIPEVKENYTSSDVSESEELMSQKETNCQIKDGNSSQLTITEPTKIELTKSSISKLRETFSKNTLNRFLSHTKNVKKSETLDENLSAASNSECCTSASSSESITTADNNCQVHTRKTSSPISLKLKQNIERTPLYKIRISLMDAFEQKLRDLGIDPEWQGIPEATFKQKMDIINYHQKLAAKKTANYHQIKLKLIHQLFVRMSNKEKRIEKIFKPEKTSPSRRILIHDKTVMAKVLNADDDPVLQDIGHSNPHLTPGVHYHATERSDDLSPNFTKKLATISNTRNSHKYSIKNDSMEKMKPLCKSLLNNKPVKDDYIESSNVQQYVQNALISSKYNKSVLKSANVSTNSLIKKKVIFHLNNEKHAESCSTESFEL